jgi:hypothetical protein
VAEEKHAEPGNKPSRQFAEFVPFAAGMFVLAVVLLFILPKWAPAPSTIEFVDAKVVQASKDQTIVEMTLSWSAPHVGNCFLANDVRPGGALKGEPETAAWNLNHLIRYNLRNGQPQVQYWINAEVLDQRKNTKTFTYILENPAANTTSLDLYSELKCDDTSLASAKRTIEYKAA